MPIPEDFHIDERLLRLRQSYGATLRDKTERLQRAARDVSRRVSLDEARALAHNIAGSAPTFGYSAVGQIARALEYRLDALLGARAPIDPDARREIEDLLRQIAGAEKQAQAGPAPQATPARHHRLLVAQGRRWLSREIVLAFERHGFDLQISDDVDSTLAHAERFRPDILIITVQPEETVAFDLAARFWERELFASVEMFFYVKAEEFAPKALLNGVPDEWFIVPPFDSQQLASRILRRVFNIKSGREAGNRACLTPYLENFKKFARAGGEPLIAAPPPAPVTAANTSAAAPPLARKRVLIVDDDRHLVEAICEVLRGRDLELFKAYSGFQGVQVATREVPDLIVTDFEMPNGSAEYLISNLRQSDSTRPIKVIVMTGHEVVERYQLSRNPASYLKVVSYQPKPIDIDNLCGEVRRHLAAA